MPKPLSKKLEKSIVAPDPEKAIAVNMDLITAAHALLTRLGYEEIEVMDLLNTASFLAGGE